MRNHRTHVVEPEVAGGLGPNTDLDSSVHPPRVHRLHCVFEGWLGDDLVGTFPCFLATERLAQAIDAAGLTGVTWASVEVEQSDQSEMLFPGTILPAWRWMQVAGDMQADVWADATAVLRVSDRALWVLRRFQIEHAMIAVDASRATFPPRLLATPDGTAGHQTPG